MRASSLLTAVLCMACSTKPPTTSQVDSAAVSRFSQQVTDSLQQRQVQADLKRALRDLAVAEETYRAEHNTYTAELSALGAQPDAGVSLRVLQSSADAWAAEALSPSSRDRCTMFIGSIPAPSPATVEGEPACESQ